MKRKIQLALNKAFKALPKSIFVEMYQKQRTVIASFNNNFKNLLVFDSFFFISISASVDIN